MSVRRNGVTEKSLISLTRFLPTVEMTQYELTQVDSSENFQKVTFGMKKAIVNLMSVVTLPGLALLSLLLNTRRPSCLGNP
jgi:hypothetical protein